MFHRPLLDVPDPVPSFCSTTSLSVELGDLPAPLRTEDHSLAVWSNPLLSQVTSPRRASTSAVTLADTPRQENSFNSDNNDLTTTVAASETLDIKAVGQLTSPLFFQQREVSSTPFCVSGFQQQAAASGSQQRAWIKCDKTIAQRGGTKKLVRCNESNFKCWRYFERKERPRSGKCANSVRKEKSPCLLCRVRSWEKIIWGWGRNGHKKLGTKKCWYCPLGNQSSSRISEIGALLGQEIAKKWRNYEESVAKKKIEPDSWDLTNHLYSRRGIPALWVSFWVKFRILSEQLWNIPRSQPTLGYS